MTMETVYALETKLSLRMETVHAKVTQLMMALELPPVFALPTKRMMVQVLETVYVRKVGLDTCVTNCSDALVTQ